MTGQTVNSMLTSARKYVKHGWIIHPLASPKTIDPETGKPEKWAGKKPIVLKWESRTTLPTDEELVMWFSNTDSFFKDCNIGLQCGKNSNVTGLDLDHMLFFDEVFEEEPKTLRSSRTKGRGHVIYENEKDLPTQSHEELLGIRVLSDGGNLVLPPSVHKSGDVYKWSMPDAPIIKMPAKLKENLLGLFKTETELKQMLSKCRHCFRTVLKRRDEIDWHGAEGREYMLAVCTDLKAHGADEEHVKMFAKLVYREKYDEEKTLDEWKNIGLEDNKTWTCAKLKEKLPSYINISECDKCDERRQKYKDKQETQTKQAIPEVNTADDIPLPQEDVIPSISFDGLPDYNFVKMFVDYIATVSDTYPEYSFQNGLAMLSMMNKRKICFRLNGRFEYLNLWLINLGPSGYSRKGTAMGTANNILKGAVGDVFLSKDITPESLLEEMADVITITRRTKKGDETVTTLQSHTTRKALCGIWKDEAGQFYAQLNKQYMQSMKELLCHFYDCPNDYEKTRSSRKFSIGEIYHTMNLATTPTSFAESVTQKDIHIGFLARHCIMNPSYVKKRKPITEDSDADMMMEKGLEQVLRLIDSFLPDKLRIHIGKKGLVLLNKWAEEREEYFAKERNDAMGSFFARFQINVLKMAALLDIGNLPYFITHFYKTGGDNSQNLETIFIRQGEIIRKIAKPLSQNPGSRVDIILHNNNNNNNFIITDMCISHQSLIYILKLFDTSYIPYSYQFCMREDLAIFANYLDNMYKIIWKKKKIDYSTWLRNSHTPRFEFNEGIETLKEAGAIVEYKVRGKTKSQRFFVFVPTPYTKLGFEQIKTDFEDDESFIKLMKKDILKSANYLPQDYKNPSGFPLSLVSGGSEGKQESLIDKKESKWTNIEYIRNKLLTEIVNFPEGVPEHIIWGLATVSGLNEQSVKNDIQRLIERGDIQVMQIREDCIRLLRWIVA